MRCQAASATALPGEARIGARGAGEPECAAKHEALYARRTSTGLGSIRKKGNFSLSTCYDFIASIILNRVYYAAQTERSSLMAKQEPSIDQWLKEAKQDPKAAQCGMFLTHNGVVRITPKQQVREGVEGLGDVAQVEFSYDAAGVDAAVEEALTWPGVYYVRVWLNEGVLGVGDSIMYVLIGADIRPNCIDALQKLVGKIKNDLVVEKEIYA